MKQKSELCVIDYVPCRAKLTMAASARSNFSPEVVAILYNISPCVAKKQMVCSILSIHHLHVKSLVGLYSQLTV
jgi:hypothetical protein